MLPVHADKRHGPRQLVILIALDPLGPPYPRYCLAMQKQCVRVKLEKRTITHSITFHIILVRI